MTKMNRTVALQGKSTKSYTFEQYSIDHTFAETWGGVYVFTNRDETSHKHAILYIGKTIQFNKRLDDHEHWDSAKKLGCNCICILNIGKEADMLTIEEDLIKGQSPKLNTQHNQ